MFINKFNISSPHNVYDFDIHENLCVTQLSHQEKYINNSPSYSITSFLLIATLPHVLFYFNVQLHCTSKTTNSQPLFNIFLCKCVTNFPQKRKSHSLFWCWLMLVLLLCFCYASVLFHTKLLHFFYYFNSHFTVHIMVTQNDALDAFHVCNINIKQNSLWFRWCCISLFTFFCHNFCTLKWIQLVNYVHIFSHFSWHTICHIKNT